MWLAVDALIDRDPKIKRAGPWACVAFLGVLRLMKRSGARGGVVSDDLLTPENLADELGFTDRQDIERLAGGLAACFEVGLLTRGDDLVWAPGWRDWQTDPTGAERQATRRERLKESRESRESRVTGVTGEETPDPDRVSSGRPSETHAVAGPSEPERRSAIEANAPGPRTRKPRQPPDPALNGDFTRVVDAFFAEWARHDPAVKPQFGKAEGARLKALLKRAPAAAVLSTIPLYWSSESAKYGTRRNFLDFTTKFDRLHEEAGTSAAAAAGRDRPLGGER